MNIGQKNLWKIFRDLVGSRPPRDVRPDPKIERSAAKRQRKKERGPAD